MIKLLLWSLALLRSQGGGDLEETIGQWYDIVLSNSAIANSDYSLEFSELEAKFPLYQQETLALWGNALATTRPYPILPRGEFVQALGNQTQNPFTWWAPKEASPNRSYPLIVVLSQQDPQQACAKAASFLGDQAVLVSPSFLGLSKQRSFDPWRLRLLDSLGFAFRNFNIDRDQVNILTLDSDLVEMEEQIRRVLPHFFCTWRETDLLKQKQIFLRDEMLARNPFPDEFIAEFWESGAGRNFWIQAHKFDPAEDGQLKARLNVKIDREANKVILDGYGVYRVDLYLNPHLIDFSREVIVERNGMVTTHTISSSSRTLLENFMINLDAQALYPAMIRFVDLPTSVL